MKKFIKIFSCVIVVISFLLLFLNWVELTPATRHTAVDIYNARFNETGKDITGFAELRDAVKKSDIDIDAILGNEEPSDYGILYKRSGIKESLNAILDGGINVPEMSLVSGTAAKLYGLLDTAMTSDTSSSGIRAGGTRAALSVFSVIVLIVFILSILAAIGTFLTRVSDKFAKYRKFDIAFFVLQIVLFVLAIVFANRANSLISAFALTGITFWSILAVILSCPMVLIEKLPFAKLEEVTGRGTVANKTFNNVNTSFNETMGKLSFRVEETAQNVKWNKELKANEEQLKDKYLELGKKYYEENMTAPPEEHNEIFSAIKDHKDEIENLQTNIDVAKNIVSCPNCKSKWTSGTKFCANCGSKLPELLQEDRTPKYESKSVKSFCKHCGAKIENDDVFCPACGESL